VTLRFPRETSFLPSKPPRRDAVSTARFTWATEICPPCIVFSQRFRHLHDTPNLSSVHVRLLSGLPEWSQRKADLPFLGPLAEDVVLRSRLSNLAPISKLQLARGHHEMQEQTIVLKAFCHLLWRPASTWLPAASWPVAGKAVPSAQWPGR
jgi:hypothetical protein